MRVLAIDTATATGSVALVSGTKLVGEYILNIKATHSERLLPALERVMADAGWTRDEVDGIAVATGPGSFTGLRIGVSTAKTLAYCWKKPLVGITVLEALAWQVGFAASRVCSLVDARRQEVYGCLYDTVGLPRPLVDYWAGPLREFLQTPAFREGGDICFVGDGAEAYCEIISENMGNRVIKPAGNSLQLRASSVALAGSHRLQAGERDDPLTLRPFYLRLSEAERRLQARCAR